MARNDLTKKVRAKYCGNMKIRSAFLILVFSLVLGSSGPVFAEGTTPARSDLVTAIQNQYNPLFDAQYARFMVLKPKVLGDAGMLKTYKALLTDFIEVRRVIDSNLKSANSDLDAVRSYAEEEIGEYGSSLSLLESQAAKSRTLTCIKGKLVKKVSGLTPKCPKGYKKK